MATSPFARLLEPDDDEADNVVAITRRPRRASAQPAERPALRHLTTT